jgi:ribonuclease HI
VATLGSAGTSAWVIHCDGSAVPNPGRMGMGAVLTAPDGTGHTLSQATTSKGCNYEAELRALIAALREGKARGAKALRVYCDSRVLVEQLGGPDAKLHVKPIERLASLFDEARQLLKSFEQASLQWIPRHRNAQADALARAALGRQPKRVLKASKNPMCVNRYP